LWLETGKSTDHGEIRKTGGNDKLDENNRFWIMYLIAGFLEQPQPEHYYSWIYASWIIGVY